MSDPFTAGDQLIEELKGPAPRDKAPTMGRLQKCAYTHDAMVDLIITQGSGPGGISQRQLAAHFGYTEGWISNVLASDAFQARLAARKEEVTDPAIKATIEERFRALVIQSLKVLETKLSAPVVSDQVALRAAELGAKALGVGGHAPPKAPEVDRLERLAERLVTLQSGVRERIVNGDVQTVEILPQQRQAATG